MDMMCWSRLVWWACLVSSRVVQSEVKAVIEWSKARAIEEAELAWSSYSKVCMAVLRWVHVSEVQVV